MNTGTIHWFDELDSTNRYLADWRRKEPALPDGTIVAAKQQTAGKGRYGRTWMSGPLTDLAFSILVSDAGPVRRRPALAMAAALAVAAALEKLKISAKVKWPNDVWVGGRKIAGVLVECIAAGGDCCVVGIGVNVNMSADQLKSIDRPATSLKTETGKRHDIAGLLDAILKEFAPRRNAWSAAGFFALREEWLKRCLDHGCSRLVTGPDGKLVDGTFRDFGPDGELRLLGPDGKTMAIWTDDEGTSAGPA